LTEKQPQTIAFYKGAGFEAADKYDCAAFVLFRGQSEA